MTNAKKKNEKVKCPECEQQPNRFISSGQVSVVSLCCCFGIIGRSLE